MHTRNREPKKNVRTTRTGGGGARASRPGESPPAAGPRSGTVEEGGGDGDGRSKVRTQKMMVVARTSRMATVKEKMDDGKAQVGQDFYMGIAAICAGRGPERAGEAQESTMASAGAGQARLHGPRMVSEALRRRLEMAMSH